MTAEQRAALIAISEGITFGNGSAFRARGVNMTPDVQWAIDQGYASWWDGDPSEPVVMSTQGYEALREEITANPLTEQELADAQMKQTLPRARSGGDL